MVGGQQAPTSLCGKAPAVTILGAAGGGATVEQEEEQAPPPQPRHRAPLWNTQQQPPHPGDTRFPF